MNVSMMPKASRPRAEGSQDWASLEPSYIAHCVRSLDVGGSQSTQNNCGTRRFNYGSMV
jgi:hypothetical protein